MTALVGGVSAEEHPFPPGDAPPFRHRLRQPPAADVVSLHGSRLGEPHEFRDGADYALSADGTQIEWAPEGEQPDPGSLVNVNYLPAGARQTLNDLMAGSVVRTLAESTALEIARLYAQLDAVYDAAFIDTATGSSLDNVVGLLGVERVSEDRPTGEVEFTRAPDARGAITIPAGTRVMKEDGSVEYFTVTGVTLAEGQQVVSVTSRDAETDNDPLGAGELTVLPVPIAGVAGVTNPGPTARAARAETDDELRTRARSFLHGSERATLGALRGAVARQRLTAEVDESATVPGLVTVTPLADELAPDVRQRLVRALEEARPAGVRVELAAARGIGRIDIGLRLVTDEDLLEQDLLAAHVAAREAIADYFDRLELKAAAGVNQLLSGVLAVRGIRDVRILSATVRDPGADAARDVLDLERGELTIAGVAVVLGELHVADPNLPTRLTVTVARADGQAPPDPAAVRAGVTPLLSALDADPESASRQLGYDDLRAATGLPAALSVEFVFALASGLVRILSAPGGTYELAAFERVTLAAVEAGEAPGG